MRHLKVAFCWEKWYHSVDFDLACKTYDSTSIIAFKIAITLYHFEKVYVSNLKRTTKTAQAICVIN